ncbi:MAG TPA: HD domain-containing protein [Candidatus Limnocylindria bacterium]|nr:HD domain-containing protein [Candidatus Limnocylindria bacterium]
MAAFLAQRCLSGGQRLDPALAEAAALLHDVDKALPHDHRLLRLGHGGAGAAWLAEQGHGELSAAVAGHPATLLADDDRYAAWTAVASLEERLVAYADKRAMQDLVSLDERYAAWHERYPEARPDIERGLARARLLEQEVCAAAGVKPAEVRRIAWVEAALRSVAPAAAQA